MELAGQRFGKLTVKRFSHIENKRTFWVCVCDCNPEKEIIIKGKYLTNGDTQSCGCLSLKRTRQMGLNNKKFNKYRIDGNVVYVKFLNCDSEFICSVQDWNEKTKNICWRKNNTGYARGTVNGKQVLFHSYILNINTKGDAEVDHINGNRLDNTRENLRICTRQNNSYNNGVYSNNTSGVTGVHWHKCSGKWTANIGYQRKQIHLGSFNDFEDAVIARQEAEKKYFKEYRRIS